MADPSYLLNGIPTALRRALSARAAEDDLSLADTIRSVLCAHYGLDCPPRGRGYDAARDLGTEQMLVRVSEELFQAIKIEAQEWDETMRAVILRVLETHLHPQSEGAPT